MGNTNHYNGLTIFGELDINGAFVLPTTDGSNGQVLQTDGLGNVTWASVSGSTVDVYVSGGTYNGINTITFTNTTGGTFTVTGITSGSTGTTSPAGSNTWVQFNNSGSFGASKSFTFNAVSGTTIESTSGTHVLETRLGLGKVNGVSYSGVSMTYQKMGVSDYSILAFGDLTPLGAVDYTSLFGYFRAGATPYNSLVNITPAIVQFSHFNTHGVSRLNIDKDISLILSVGTTNGFNITNSTGSTLFEVNPSGITFNNVYTFPNNIGSLGQTLISDGIGGLTWSSTTASTFFAQNTTGFTPGIYSTGLYGNSADGDGGSFAVGTTSKASGLSSMALGNLLRVYGNQSAALGGGNNEIYYGADYSAIIGGTNLELLSGASESVMLGGSDYTGTTSGTTYVPSIDIRNNITLNTSITASTANVGVATLPANPVGFIIVVIDGIDYKLPYYNT